MLEICHGNSSLELYSPPHPYKFIYKLASYQFLSPFPRFYMYISITVSCMTYTPIYNMPHILRYKNCPFYVAKYYASISLMSTATLDMNNQTYVPLREGASITHFSLSSAVSWSHSCCKWMSVLERPVLYPGMCLCSSLT